MNVENIKKVRDHIASLPPERFYMDDWARPTDGRRETVEPEDLLHDCNTAGCIAGWTIAVLKPGRRPDEDFYKDPAQRVLGLSRSRAHALFIHCDGETAAQAVRVLDHLLATGEVDWTVAEAVTA